VFTCSGGDSLMAADAAAPLGIALPQPTRACAEALRRILPDFATVANPLDYNTSLWGHREELVRCFSALLSDPYDAAMLVIDYPHEGIAGRPECDISVDALVEAAGRAGIPAAVCSTLPELLPPEARDRLIAAGVAPLQGLPEALAAFAAAIRHGARRAEVGRAGAQALRLPPLGPAPPNPVLLDEARSKAELASFGLGVPAARAVPPERAAEAAAELGFPVVVKVLAPVLPHKTEAGGVALNLASADAIEEALATMQARLSAAGAGGLQTVLVESMVTDAVAELIVGVVRDERLGPALVIGGGGVLVELARDTQRLLLPASREEIGRALSRLAAASSWRAIAAAPPATSRLRWMPSSQSPPLPMPIATGWWSWTSTRCWCGRAAAAPWRSMRSSGCPCDEFGHGP
jgi:acyl-CoA synthetase (NDP forming)